jgi:hypothetical protein
VFISERTREQAVSDALYHHGRGEKFCELMNEEVTNEDWCLIYDALRDGKDDVACKLIRQQASVWRAMERWHDDRAEDSMTGDGE